LVAIFLPKDDIAYGLYKRDKRVWLFEFREAEGRDPSPEQERITIAVSLILLASLTLFGIDLLDAQSALRSLSGID
jgi:hypothetical protein